jgi:hypothetical protein
VVAPARPRPMNVTSRDWPHWGHRGPAAQAPGTPVPLGLGSRDQEPLRPLACCGVPNGRAVRDHLDAALLYEALAKNSRRRVRYFSLRLDLFAGSLLLMAAGSCGRCPSGRRAPRHRIISALAKRPGGMEPPRPAKHIRLATTHTAAGEPRRDVPSGRVGAPYPPDARTHMFRAKEQIHMNAEVWLGLIFAAAAGTIGVAVALLAHGAL